MGQPAFTLIIVFCVFIGYLVSAILGALIYRIWLNTKNKPTTVITAKTSPAISTSTGTASNGRTVVYFSADHESKIDEKMKEQALQ